MKHTTSYYLEKYSSPATLVIAILAGYLSKTNLHLCDPASVYIGIAVFGNLLLTFGSRIMTDRVGKKYTYYPPSMLVVGGLLASGWTWLITMACAKHAVLSWVLAILPLPFFILFNILSHIR